ncbi:MAG: DUF2267 domain-containing protein [Phormidesmis priestleyi]|uniref:DUF2267 domain-containing protein n=1 Tax=Phormidesmis priestleyi TaxID=268141 RepID=A0A2W4YRW5_9CYAN|nr:MAG: DUF2267 domain-containing protein [Phormidesmis priestleyi]
MADSAATEQKPFLEKVVEDSPLHDINEAQVATKVVFRLLRDLMPTDEIKQLEEEFEGQESGAETSLAELWDDPNVMVAFFSRISPLRQLSINAGTFFLRLQQEGALPKDVDPKAVTKAIFSATQDELPQSRIDEIAQFLPDEIRQLWEQQ